MTAGLALSSGCYSPTIPSGAQKCAANDRCPEGFSCFPDKHCYVTGSKVSCSPVCASGTVCDLTSLKCVQCLADGDCPSGDICVAQVCKPGCSAGHPTCLPDSGSCDVDLGACRGCLKDSECTDGAKPRCDKESGLCQPCIPSDDQCPTGRYCAGKAGQYSCVAGCSSDAQCRKAAQGADGGANNNVTCCNNKCVDVTADAANCGRCGTACMNGNLCCAGACVDQKSDVANCGTCGNLCMAKAVGMNRCTAGMCGYDKCTPGFGDCDNNAANGCETTISTDVKNCGACGMDCGSPANGTAKCVAAMCGVDCNVGAADCNRQFNDGCEVNTTNDIRNCGACGAVCGTPQNSLPTCVGSMCGFTCLVNFQDCNKQAGDGCESAKLTDAKNCGACGRVCVAGANQSTSCSAGLCKNVCNPNFGDCDNNQGNGCEVNLLTDVNNCGACGKVCAAGANQTATCTNGVCGTICAKGFADCDGAVGNGCEANLSTDAANCGRCGAACALPKNACVNAACSYPLACTNDKDQNGSQFTICAMNNTGAWMSALNVGGCSFNAQAICLKYGFTKVTRWGGTCGTVCGYCGNFSCMAPQGQFVLGGAYTNFDGGGGAPAALTCTVQWECAP